MHIAYIGPHGYSGSTVLDVALAQHPDVVSGGELCYLPLWLEQDLLCTCLVPISRCEFWLEVLRFKLRIDLLALGNQKWSGRPGRFGACAYSDNMQESRVWAQVIHRLSEVSGASHVVDSSKTTSRYQMLRQVFKDDITFIHLVRRIAEVVDSSKNAKPSPAFRNGATTLPSSAWRTVARWILDHGEVEYRQRLEGWRYLRASYTELSSAPSLELSHLCENLGLEFDSRMLNLDVSHLHNISGSRWRFSEAARRGELFIGASPR